MLWALWDADGVPHWQIGIDILRYAVLRYLMQRNGFEFTQFLELYVDIVDLASPWLSHAVKVTCDRLEFESLGCMMSVEMHPLLLSSWIPGSYHVIASNFYIYLCLFLYL